MVSVYVPQNPQFLINPKFQSIVTPKKKVSVEELYIPTRWRDFAKKCVIRGDRGLQYFDPYEYQIELIKTIHTHRMTVITKTRQLGFTEAIANYFLWKACLIPGYLGVVFSKGQSDTSNVARRVRRYLDSLGVQTMTNALTDIEIVGGGRIVFRNSAPDGARSLDSVWDILFDEAGFCKFIEEIYQSAQPTTTVMGDLARIIILSTPNGQSGWYWDKLNAANSDRDLLKMVDNIRAGTIDPVQKWVDEDGAAKFICHWMAHPKFSLKKDTYLDEIKRVFKLTEESVQQEYNLSFEMGESIVFPPKLVRDRAVGQFEEPDLDYMYYGALDTSLLGSDYTVFLVLKYDPLDGSLGVVAMYRARKKAHPVNIYYIGELIKDFNIAKVSIEVNSAGQVYYDELSTEFLGTEFIAVKTTDSSKKPMINKVILAMECELFKYPDAPYIVNEFLGFRDLDGKLKAPEGQHDDIVMAAAIGLSHVPLDFNAKQFVELDNKMVTDQEPDRVIEAQEPKIPERPFSFMVKLHSLYPDAIKATDETIQGLPGKGQLRKDDNGQYDLNNAGHAIVDCEDIEFLKFALVNQGYVARVVDFT